MNEEKEECCGAYDSDNGCCVGNDKVIQRQNELK
jgi:hypothetical protein